MFAFTVNILHAQNKGVIRGKVIDEETQSPVEGAIIELFNRAEKMETDAKGEFVFGELEFDSYQIKVTSIGYNPQIISDLILYASKPLNVTIELSPQGITTEQIDVEANFFQQSSDVNISSLNLDYEEIRRAPGATEDISRMLQSAPGVAIGNDQRNDIIIRGDHLQKILFS